MRRTNDDAPDLSFARFMGEVVDGAQWNAPDRLKAPSLMTDEATLLFHERADWQNVIPEMQIFAARLVEAARQKGVPLYVHSAFRTKEQQNLLNDQGVSKVRWPRAAHCLGRAVDIVHCRYHWNMTRQEWEYLGKIGLEVARHMRINVRWGAMASWGGGFRTVNDPAHWEMADWAEHVAVLPVGEPVRMTPRGILAKWKGGLPGKKRPGDRRPSF